MDIKDKPSTMPIKRWLVKYTAFRNKVPSSLVQDIVDHEFDMAVEAIGKWNTIEISGFCRFYLNMKRSLKKLEKFRVVEEFYNNIINDPTVEYSKKESTRYKLGKLLIDIDSLEKRIKLAQDVENRTNI